MVTKSLLLFISLLFFNTIQKLNFFDQKLADLDNQIFSFSELKNNKATAIVLLLSDCPASESYTLTLNNFAKKYSDKKIPFIGIFPGKYSTDEELIEFRKKYKIKFPLLKDPEMIVSKNLNATVAPGCFLVDDKGTIVYQGRIDDWLYALGKKRQVITEHNLNDAIKSVINNTEIKIKETMPIGCILEYDSQ